MNEIKNILNVGRCKVVFTVFRSVSQVDVDRLGTLFLRAWQIFCVSRRRATSLHRSVLVAGVVESLQRLEAKMVISKNL